MITEGQRRNLKVGDKIKRIAGGTYGNTKVGDILTITKVEDNIFQTDKEPNCGFHTLNYWELVQETQEPNVVGEVTDLVKNLLEIKKELKEEQSKMSILQSKYDRLKNEIIRKL